MLSGMSNPLLTYRSLTFKRYLLIVLTFQHDTAILKAPLRLRKL